MQPLMEYPDVSPRDFALGICANLHTELGVDVVPVLNSPGLSDRQKIRTVAQLLTEAIFDRAYRHGFADFLADITDPAESEPIAAQLGLDRAADSIDTEPNMAISEKDSQIILGYEGEQLKTYLFNLTKRFENMSKATSVGVLVAEMAGGAVISVGVPAAVGVVKALRAGQTLLAAMRTGIMGIGMKTVITAVVVVLAALLAYLLWENPKKILGMVLNNTTENFVVNAWNTGKGDLHMEHGEMVDFMQDNVDGLDSPYVQIKQKLNFGPNDPDNVVFAGFYFADRNIGFRGSEGVVVFTSQTSQLMFAHQFAVPYVNDNGTNIRYLDSHPSDLGKLFREMYDSRKVRVDVTTNSYRFTSTVNDARGGVVACVASINGPL